MRTTVVEELESPRAGWKVEIVQRSDGTLQVFLQRWMDTPSGRGWSEVTTAASITDSIESARAIAHGLLERHAADEYTLSDDEAR